MRIQRIISGGQTGADRAALDAAIEFGIPHGGWCPYGRLAEDGRIDSRYQLKETEDVNHAQRTELNVRDSDATLIVAHGVLTGGTELTCRMAKKYNKPYLHIDLATMALPDAARQVQRWIAEEVNDNSVLNVAGPRQSEDPQIYFDTMALVASILPPHVHELTNRNLDIVLNLRAQTLAALRQWERQLLAIPFGVAALTGIALAIKSQMGFPTTLVRDGLTGLGLLTLLALLGMGQIIGRHNRQLRAFRSTAARVLPFTLANTLLAGMPPAYGPNPWQRPALFMDKLARFELATVYYAMTGMIGVSFWAFAAAQREWLPILIGVWVLAAFWLARRDSYTSGPTN